MANASEDKSLEERYALLQNFCRHQIMINETLKLELNRMGTLLRKVSDEKSLLLRELVVNHSACDRASKEGNPIDPITEPSVSHSQKRSAGQYCQAVSKKFKNSPINIENLQQSLQSPQTVNGVTVTEDTVCGELVVQTEQKPNSSRTPSSLSASPVTTTAVTRAPISRLQNLATQLNAVTVAGSDRPAGQSSCSSHSASGSGSPPSVTVSICSPPCVPRTKPSCLLTTSSLTNSGVSLVPFSSPKGHPPARYPTPGVSVSTHGLNSSPSVGLSRPNFPVNVVVGAHSLSNPQTVHLSGKTTHSTSSGNAIRAPFSSPGQRILIQPSSTNVRSILLHPPDSYSSTLTEDPQ